MVTTRSPLKCDLVLFAVVVDDMTPLCARAHTHTHTHTHTTPLGGLNKGQGNQESSGMDGEEAIFIPSEIEVRYFKDL